MRLEFANSAESQRDKGDVERHFIEKVASRDRQSTPTCTSAQSTSTCGKVAPHCVMTIDTRRELAGLHTTREWCALRILPQEPEVYLEREADC